MKLSRRNFLKNAAMGTAAAAAASVAASAGVALADEAAATSDQLVMPDVQQALNTGADAAAIQWADQAEVVVVGCGSGGAPAAIEAARAGADVLVIEKMDWLGGCMRRCGGGLMGCNTLVQQKLGIEDPGTDVLYDYMAACAGNHYDPDLLRTFVENAGPCVDWVITPVEEGGLGGQPLEEWELGPEDGMQGIVSPGLNVGAPSDVENNYWEELGFGSDIEHRRVHWFKSNPEDVDPGDRQYAAYTGNDFGAGYGSVGGGGTGLWKPFEDELYNLENVRIQMETTIKGIIMNANGEAIGVSVAPTAGGDAYNIKATKAVIIATGTFVCDKEMYENFTGKPWTYEEDPRSIVNGSPYNDYQADGAGVKALLAVGVAPRYIIEGNSGGMRINSNAQAINTYGEIVPRLYITSRAVGGLFAEDHYPQCGVFVTSGIVFGRIAGINASALPAWE